MFRIIGILSLAALIGVACLKSRRAVRGSWRSRVRVDGRGRSWPPADAGQRRWCCSEGCAAKMMSCRHEETSKKLPAETNAREMALSLITTAHRRVTAQRDDARSVIGEAHCVDGLRVIAVPERRIAVPDKRVPHKQGPWRPRPDGITDPSRRASASRPARQNLVWQSHAWRQRPARRSADIPPRTPAYPRP